MKKLLILFVLLLNGMSAIYGFTVDGISYETISSEEVKVIQGDYSGQLVLPSTVSYDGKEYVVTSIGIYAFSGCTGLTSITIGNSVTNIENEAFYSCSGLTSVTIPNSVTRIGDKAFYGCSSMTSVTIGNSVTRIGARAFYGCSSLTSITIPKSVTIIETVDLENYSTTYYDYQLPEILFGCSSLTEIIVEEGNPVYDSRDNCNAIIVTSTNTLLCGCKNTVIPNSVKTIAKGAFKGCTDLTSVIIPNSVTDIGMGAFRDCTGLTSLFIPKSVKSIARSEFIRPMGTSLEYISGSFYGCTGLTKIVVEEGNPVYDSRDNCNAIIVTSTNTLLCGCNNTVIPNSVMSIDMEAFYGCNGLTTVTIPSSVTSIGECAFSGCSALTTVMTQMKNPPTIFKEYYQYQNIVRPNSGDANTVFSNRANAVLYVRKGCKETYENASGWDFGEIIELTDATITISSAGVATYCPDGDLDFTDVDGLKAYIATAYDTQTHDVTMMRVYDVPAGTGLYLKGEAGTYTLPYSTSYSYYVNLLKGTLIPITLAQKEGNMTNFILSNGASGLGFYPLSKDGPFGADKAYLQVPTGTTYQGAKMLNLVFEESESTDIQEITADNGDDSYYSLTGVKVERPSKGIYIYKGKKVMIK